MIFDDRLCELGEGAFWHPGRHQLFWFDILNQRMMSRGEHGAYAWRFSEMVSAAGWIGPDELLVASESSLARFSLLTGERTHLCDLDAGNPGTRSNDGKADRHGGFWIGTMSKKGGDGPGEGGIWRWYRGELRKLFPGITIPNSICFSIDGRTAYFSDTVTHLVHRVALDTSGWPKGNPEVFLDLTEEGLFPDGATVDAAGTVWIAQWGAGRVAAYAPDGRFIRAVKVGGAHSSCPAFGGAQLSILYVTSALEGMSEADRLAHPDAGKTFALPAVGRGVPEPQVILP